VGIDESGQQRVMRANDSLARLEALAHLHSRSQRKDPSGANGDSVFRQDGVDRGDRQQPAGFNE
jgi:hypothetical protein